MQIRSGAFVYCMDKYKKENNLEFKEYVRENCITVKARLGKNDGLDQNTKP